MDIDEAGAFSSEKAKQQAEIRAKLAAGERLSAMLAMPQLCRQAQDCACSAVHVDELSAASRLFSSHAQQLSGSAEG